MAKRLNGDGSISRYKDGWRARYTDPVTHKQRAVYGKTQGECKEKLESAKTAIKTKKYVAPDKRLVCGWVESWFTDYYTIGTKPSTQSTTWRGLQTYILPKIGKIPLQKLSTDDIQSLIRSMESRNLSPSTIKRHIVTLSQCLQQAVKNKKISENPVNAAKFPESEKREIKAYTEEEQAVLLQNLPNTTNGRAIRFLLGTGMRVSEMCGLKWNDVKDDVIHVQRQHMTIKDWQSDGYIDIESSPKTKNGKRIVPLNKSLVSLLDEQRKAQAEERIMLGEAYSYSGYIFATETGKPQDRNNIGRTLRSTCRRAGLPQYGVHSLRHTFASQWVRYNSDIVTLSRILGHADAGFTYRVYCHSDQAAMQKGMEMMENIIAEKAL